MSNRFMIALAVLVVIVGVAVAGTIPLKRYMQTAEFCANCHVQVPYYNSWKSSLFSAHTHAQMSLDCQDCYAKNASAAMAHTRDKANLDCQECNTQTVRAALELTHAQMNLTCKDCHTQSTLASVAELVNQVFHNYQIPLKDHGVRPEECLRCHVSYAYLADRTKDLKGPDGFPLGRNPHDSHWGQLDCGICHKMHKTSIDYCAECHGLPATGPEYQD